MRSDVTKSYRLFLAMGNTPEQVRNPFIGVVNSQSDLVCGHLHLDQIATAVKHGVISAGGTPFEFSTIAVCDGISQGHAGMCYPLGSRELVADSVETVVLAHALDGMVLIATCDEIVPGMMMAAARLDIPAIVITGGTMLPSKPREDVYDPSCNIRSIGVTFIRTGYGACPGGALTANTMACMTEALGIALPWNSCIPATYGERLHLAKYTGAEVIEMWRKEIKPSQILTREAFENAITVLMALGGSPNAIIHLMAIANEVGMELSLDLFEKISRRTPRLCALAPSGPYFMEDIYLAGGLQVLMKELSKKGLLHLDTLTVSGKRLGEIIAGAKNKSQDAIRDIENPYDSEGGLAVLYGNITPEGAVVRQSTVLPQMLRHSGPSRVFNLLEEAIDAIKQGKINKGDTIVVKYEGPRGGPGFRELLAVTNALEYADLEGHVAIVTDGRFSARSRGASIGHVSPEAFVGGPFAIVEEGDIIDIDIPNRSLNVRLSDKEIARRLAAWSPPPPKRAEKSFLQRYAAMVTSASKGAILKVPGA